MNLITMVGAYLQYWRVNFLTMLEYRANFIMWFVFTIVYHGVALAALYVTMQQFPSMNGWDFRQMFFLYALWMTGHELHNVLFFNVVAVPDYVREGRFDRFLVRPLDTLFQVLTVPSQLSPDGIVIAIVTLAVATSYGARPHRLRSFVVFVPLIVFGGALIDLGISLVVATISFWFIRVDTLRWVVMSLEQDFTRYPISIYTRGVQIVLAFLLPFAFMNYFPATYFLQKAETGLHLNPVVGLLTPAIGVVWLAIAYCVLADGPAPLSGDRLVNRRAFVAASGAFAALPGIAWASSYEHVETIAHSVPGVVGVYCRTLADAPPVFSFNENVVFPTASTIKMLIMTTAYVEEERNPGTLAHRITTHRSELIGGSDFMAAQPDGARLYCLRADRADDHAQRQHGEQLSDQLLRHAGDQRGGRSASG